MADDGYGPVELPSLHALALSPSPAPPSSSTLSSSALPPPHLDSDSTTPRAHKATRSSASQGDGRDPGVLVNDQVGRPTPGQDEVVPIRYRAYQGEEDLEAITKLVDEELSEPYNLYTYRYFLDEWPHLCFFALSGDDPIGVIICKQEPHTKSSRSLPITPGEEGAQEGERRPLMRGYLAMLSTKKAFRGRGIATHLLRLSLSVMLRPPASLLASLPSEHPSRQPVDEVVLETEADNAAALAFYSKMGFVREKRLHRFYLNGKDAYRLRLDLSLCQEGETAA